MLVYHAKHLLWLGGHDYLAQFSRATWSLGQYLAFGLDMLSAAGYEMVIFFFVLSGFFIRHAQLRKHRPPLAFYWNRIVRIYPPYLASVGLAVVVLGLLSRLSPTIFTAAGHQETNEALAQAAHDLRHFQPADLGRILLFQPAPDGVFWGYNAVYWSLLPEALFYLLVPLAFWRIRAYYWASGLLYLGGVAVGVAHWSTSAVGDFFLTFNAYFAAGAALYDTLRRPEARAWLRRVPGTWLGAAALALGGVLLGLALMKWRLVAGLAATALAGLTVAALLTGRVPRRNLAVRLFHPLGRFSFSLYLYHFPFLLLSAAGFTAAFGTARPAARYYWLVVLPVTLCCYLLYWLTERLTVRYFRQT